MKRRDIFLLSLAVALRPFRLQAQSSFDFHLRADSPAIRAGVFLPEVTTDFDGKARPNPPSAGAYEYQSSSQVPIAPPTNLLVK